ncbi:uncharacterized protein LOC121906507 [Thunnus maccoyii]|uniref:uncharacterized protein LOC121906507 n=1 Tax=Thunnus maccoyii TaxID=8240 RepID=UPI001C4AD06E|nr:uncharacterized protein LOC121906507 [Thunnus maccoyii]
MNFQKLLLDISNALRLDEVKALAFLCTELLGRRPTSVDLASDLFSCLVDRNHLSPEQPHLLTELLLTIQRTQLVRDLGLNDQASTTRRLISPYRKLIYDLSEDITDEDLKQVKFLLREQLPRRKLAENVTTLEVFQEMEHKDLLSSTNLTLLRSIIESVCPILKEKINRFEEVQERFNGPIAQEGPEQNQYMNRVASERDRGRQRESPVPTERGERDDHASETYLGGPRESEGQSPVPTERGERDDQASETYLGGPRESEGQSPVPTERGERDDQRHIEVDIERHSNRAQSRQREEKETTRHQRHIEADSEGQRERARSQQREEKEMTRSLHLYMLKVLIHTRKYQHLSGNWKHLQPSKRTTASRAGSEKLPAAAACLKTKTETIPVLIVRENLTEKIFIHTSFTWKSHPPSGHLLWKYPLCAPRKPRKHAWASLRLCDPVVSQLPTPPLSAGKPTQHHSPYKPTIYDGSCQDGNPEFLVVGDSIVRLMEIPKGTTYCFSGNLLTMFEWLGFEIEIQRDCKREEMLSAMP